MLLVFVSVWNYLTISDVLILSFGSMSGILFPSAHFGCIVRLYQSKLYLPIPFPIMILGLVDDLVGLAPLGDIVQRCLYKSSTSFVCKPYVAKATDRLRATMVL